MIGPVLRVANKKSQQFWKRKTRQCTKSLAEYLITCKNLSELQYNCNSSWVYLQLTSTYTASLTPSNSYKESFHSVVLDAMNRLSTYICWNTPSGQCCAVKFFLYSCGEPLFPRTFSLIHFSCLHSEWVKEAPALTLLVKLQDWFS